MISRHKIDSLRSNQAVEWSHQFLKISVAPVEQVAGDQHHRGVLRVDLGHNARKEARAQDSSQMHVGNLHQRLALPGRREVLDPNGAVHEARVVGVRDAIGGIEKRQSHCRQAEPHRAGASDKDAGNAPTGPRQSERGKKRESHTQPKGGAEIEDAGKKTVIPMGEEGRGDEAQRKQEENQRQRRPVLERGEAKEIQDGRVDKVMPEEKNRKRDENEERNKNNTSLHNIHMFRKRTGCGFRGVPVNPPL